MRRYEKPGRPVLEDPLCGRRKDHTGVCISEATLARDALRRSRYKDERREKYREARDAGFSPAEATRFKNWAELPEACDELAA